MAGTAGSNLPPGFRFHPTDEELIVHYLKNQAMSRPCPVSIIPQVDIYKFDPWQLPAKGGVGEKEWYFFSPRDRKYPNGVRPNRATVSGYWKATGTDKAIYSGTKCVGIKKALVFYQGRPPKGNKTDWIMHEYRLNEPRAQPVKRHGSMRLDDWVLCRIYKKKHAGRTPDQKLFEENSQRQAPPMAGTNQLVASTTTQDSVQHQVLKFPRTVSFAQLLDMDYLGPVSHMLNDNSSFSTAFEFQGSLDRSRNGLTTTGERSRLGEAPYVQYSDLTTMSTMNQPNRVLQYDSPLSKLA